MRLHPKWGLMALASSALLVGTAAFGAAIGPSAAAAGGFSAPVPISGARVGEPGINVGRDGAIYVNGPAGLLSGLPGSASPVFKSNDGGASWVTTDPGQRANLAGGGDSNISIDPTTGNLYMTDLWLGSATVSRSTDGAANWVANPLQGVVVQDRQWVAAAGDGAVYHVTHQIPTGLVVSRSVTPLDGLVYPQHVIAATPLDQAGCVCPPGNLIAEAGGLLGDQVGVIYATSTGGVNFAHSANSGLSFTNSPVGPASSGTTSANFPVVANAGGGHLVAVWLEINGSTDRVLVNDSHDWGTTWGTPRPLVTTGTSVYPWIDVRGSKVAISLYHTSDTATPDTVSATAQWFESYLESTDGGTSFTPLTTIDPTPAKTGAVCTSGISCSGSRELGDFQSVTIDPAGRANVAYDRVAGTTIQTMFDRQS